MAAGLPDRLGFLLSPTTIRTKNKEIWMMRSQWTGTMVKMLVMVMFLQVMMPFQGERVLASTAIPDIKIQFQSPDSSQTNNYLSDYGELYGLRNGYTYGWNVDHTQASVTSVTYNSPLLDSSIKILAGGVWELEVPNNSYNLKISVGNSVYASENTLQVEGMNYWDHASLPPGGEETLQNTVSVTDGKLTIQGDPSSDSTSIHYVEISEFVPVIREMAKPSIGLPAVQNKISGEKVLLSGKQNNEHNAVPSINIPGLDQEIGRYLIAEKQILAQRWQAEEQEAVECGNCDASNLEALINNSADAVIKVKAGHLNLDSSVTLGSPSKPVYMFAEGINTNQNISITVYGTLVVKGNWNANTQITVRVLSPNDFSLTYGGNLWIGGTFHLNDDSNVQVSNELTAGSLTFNNGELDVQAKRLIVSNSMHINTVVDMTIDQEILIGDLVSNNQTANINVQTGDLFIRDDIHVNNQLDVRVGGIVAIGGSMTANQKPNIVTGAGENGQTKLKYSLYGLKAEYYTEEELDGDKITVVDEQVSLQGKPSVSSAGLSDGSFSVRWTGQIEPYFTDSFQFEADVKDGIKLWVDGVLLIDHWQAQGPDKYIGNVELEAGRKYDIQMEYVSRGGSPKAKLTWESGTVNKEVVPQSQLTPFSVPMILTDSAEHEVTVHWTVVFNADGYEVEADGLIFPLGVQNDFIQEGLDSGTIHQYRVRAISGDIKGEWSWLTQPWTLPDVPGNIHTQSTSSSVSLQWDEVRGATGYDIETYNTVIYNGNVTQYSENNLNPNMQRTYRIRAKNASGVGKWSPIISESTLPGATGSLNVVATDTSITVSWDAVSGASGYDLEVDGAVLNSINETQYVHENLQSNSTHTYRVRSMNDEGTSEWSELVMATTLPSVPHNLRATVGNTNIKLHWDEVSGATEYDIEADGVIVENGLSTTYTHAGLEKNTEHVYRVRAKSGSVVGEWSELITRTTLSDIPSNLRTTATGDEITVTWDRVIGATGYDIEVDGRIVDNGLNLTYDHKGLLPYSEHTYRVRARNTWGNGPWSELIAQVTGLGNPRNIKLVSTFDSITITWDAVEEATNYELAIDGELVKAGNVTRYINSGLTPNTWHVYRIRAKNADVVGEWSETFRKMTGLGTPVISDVESLSTQNTIRWDGVVGAEGYDVEVDGTIVNNRTDTIYIHKDLVPGSEHTYRVRAKAGEEYSEWSELVTVIAAPGVPIILYATATTNSITIVWLTVPESGSYDLEINGKIVARVPAVASDQARYVHKGLKANTMHVFRVRAVNEAGSSNWSERYTKSTIPEMVVNPGKDNKFNLVVAVPKIVGVLHRTITVKYDPDHFEVLDLSGITPKSEQETGLIEGTNMTVTKFVPGEIVIEIFSADKTTLNSIVFLAKTNEDSKVTYLVE